MREILNSSTLFNTLAMIRAESMKPILVVEGDDDLFLIKPHLADGVFIVKGTGGKSGVLDTARCIEARCIAGVLILVDSDYDEILGQNRPYPSCVKASTHHDIIMDTIIVNQHVLERMIEAFSRHRARKNGSEFHVKEWLKSARSLAALVACLRLVNHRDQLELNLRDFPFGSLKSIAPTVEEIAKLALDRSVSDISFEDLTNRVQREVEANGHLRDQIIGDHDLFRAIARVMVSHGVSGVGAEQLWTTTLAALRCDCIMQTNWFTSINRWSADLGELGLNCPCAA